MKIGVSDHAMMRFLERAGGFDVEALRAQIQDSLARAHATPREIGVRDYTVKSGGVIFVVRGGTIVTVVGDASYSREGAAR
ncbi:MAG: hypothetical protein WB816_03010 [Methylocystis sp.]